MYAVEGELNMRIKNLKVNGPLVLAVFLGITFAACQNNQLVEQHKQETSQIELIEFDEAFQEKPIDLESIDLEPIEQLDVFDEIDLIGNESDDIFSK